MKFYFKGGSEIKEPVDYDGNLISVGDIITTDYLDPFFSSDVFIGHSKFDVAGDFIAKYEGKGCYEVKLTDDGKSLYGCGIGSDLYLHDFRFKYCRVINETGGLNDEC